MKKLLIFALIFLLPSAVSEMSHSPSEVASGDSFTAIIDAEEDVKKITFYVCTLKDPYTCYKPEKMDRNDSINGRFQFTYQVKDNDYPGYKYYLEKDDGGNETIPRQDDFAHYEGLEVEKMEDTDSYYFRVDIKSETSDEDSRLSSINLISIAAIMAIIALSGRR